MSRTRARPSAPPPAADEYPYSDGKIMAETPRHVDAIVYALATLRTWFADYTAVQVGANMFVYYQEGDTSKRLTPDLFVVRGLEALPERSYKLWEQGRPPTFVLEVASPSTEGRDRGEKQALYASMGVAEYWRFAPTGYLKDPEKTRVRLVGGVLQGLGYDPLVSRPDGSIRSEVLGLDVRVDERSRMGHLLRFRDPATRQDLLTFQESEEGRREALEILSRERATRRAAERNQDEAERARHEAKRAQREAERARREVEGEVALLRAQVARLERRQGGGSGSQS